MKEDYQEYVKTLTNQFEYQKKQGLIDLFVQETITPKIKVSDQEVIDAYEKNKDTLFKSYEERSISHIVVKTEKEANDIHRKLRNGANFKTLAKTKSIDKTTATKSGKIPGSFSEQNLSKEFKDPIFKLKRNGSYTKPIKSEAGYHIFKLDAKEIVKAKKLNEEDSEMFEEENGDDRDTDSREIDEEDIFELDEFNAAIDDANINNKKASWENNNNNRSKTK